MANMVQPCLHCGLVFDNEHNQSAHLATVRGCVTCGLELCKNSMSQHIVTHHGRCGCGFSSEHFTVIENHKKGCSQVPITCDICGMSFVRTQKGVAAHRKHRRTHSTSQCVVCAHKMVGGHMCTRIRQLLDQRPSGYGTIPCMAFLTGFVEACQELEDYVVEERGQPAAKLWGQLVGVEEPLAVIVNHVWSYKPSTADQRSAVQSTADQRSAVMVNSASIVHDVMEHARWLRQQAAEDTRG